MEKRDLVTKLKSCKKAIARERDTLRNLLAEYIEIIENCEEVDEYLQEAIDKLSGTL